MNWWVTTAALVWLASILSAEAKIICTVVVDVRDDKVLRADGDCDSRQTPASTFKVPLALMGFDAGVLSGTTAPVMTIRNGDPDWDGADWRKPVTPAAWMRHSVVWYSQRIAEQLGEQKLASYARRFRYGNADFSGDPGQNNGLKRSWITSSLQISPKEQALFLARLHRRDLGVSAKAYTDTATLLEQVAAAGGWAIKGKTGLSFPRRADGSFDRGRGLGWYVGVAEHEDGRRIAFARLEQDEGRQSTPPSTRAKNGIIGELGRLVSDAGQTAPQQTAAGGWAAEKCRRYQTAWRQLMTRRGFTDLSGEFLANHEAFMWRGCEDPRDVCPRSTGELDVANQMSIAAMNAGTASTFLPFSCRATQG
jgi:beta-lactamase class D